MTDMNCVTVKITGARRALWFTRLMVALAWLRLVDVDRAERITCRAIERLISVK